MNFDKEGSKFEKKKNVGVCVCGGEGGKVHRDQNCMQNCFFFFFFFNFLIFFFVQFFF